MAPPRKRKRGLRKLAILGLFTGSAFGYRRYRLANAPTPSWDAPS